MASAAAAVRAEVAEALAEVEVDGQAVGVVDHIPDVITPPLVIIGTGDPYLTPGDTFNGGELAMSLEVYAVAGSGASDVELDALEQIVEGIAAAMPSEFVSASAPFVAPVGGLAYLASRIKITTLYTLEKGTT